MSDIYRKGVSPQTRAIHSSRNILSAVSSTDQSKLLQIGVVSSFNPTDNRDVEAVRGIGFGDQIAELVPQMSQPITISLQRTALYQMNIFQALGYKGGIDGLVRALKHHRWPFDLKQEIVLSEAADYVKGEGPQKMTSATAAQAESVDSSATNPEGYTQTPKAIATLYAGCWLTSYSATYSADTAIISEDVNLSVTDIFAWGAGSVKPLTTLDNLSGTGKSQILK